MNFKTGQQVKLRHIDQNIELRHHYGRIFTVKYQDGDLLNLYEPQVGNRNWFAWRMEPIHNTPETWFKEG